MEIDANIRIFVALFDSMDEAREDILKYKDTYSNVFVDPTEEEIFFLYRLKCNCMDDPQYPVRDLLIFSNIDEYPEKVKVQIFSVSRHANIFLLCELRELNLSPPCVSNIDMVYFKENGILKCESIQNFIKRDDVEYRKIIKRLNQNSSFGCVVYDG
jgi:hypothetical protein